MEKKHSRQKKTGSPKVWNRDLWLECGEGGGVGRGVGDSQTGSFYKAFGPWIFGFVYRNHSQFYLKRVTKALEGFKGRNANIPHLEFPASGQFLYWETGSLPSRVYNLVRDLDIHIDMICLLQGKKRTGLF